MNVMDLGREEFLDELAVKTSANEIFIEAPDIYQFLTRLFGQNCTDSLLREWAFQWYCEVTGDDYENIYERWLNAGTE